MTNNTIKSTYKHNPFLAYKRNETMFLNRKFYINRDAYVPNPETELMVLHAINYIKLNGLQEGTFIDVGTGCGNIAISLAKEFPKAKIIASDISNEALEVAKKNIKSHKVENIHFETDLISDIDEEPDLIIGNLPWGDDDHLLQTNTKEALALMPSIAIFAPDGIIGSYVRLCSQILSKNWTTVLFCEVGVLTKDIIEENILPNIKWQYKTLPSDKFNYSILKINFKSKDHATNS